MPIYEIQMPNGKTLEIEGPEGATDEQLYNAGLAHFDAQANKYAKEAEQGAATRKNVAEEMPWYEQAAAGVGQGMVDMGRKAVNLALPESMEPEWATDEAIAAQAAEDEDLLDTGWGTAGSVLGGTVATAPVGGAVGGLLKAGARALPAAGRVAAANPLTARMGSAAAEGAAVGTIAAPPDQRAEGAGVGAAASAAVPLVGRALSKTLGGLKEGVFKLTPEAQQLAREGVDVPIALGAESPLARRVYGDLLPVLPGGGAIPKQAQKAFDKWRTNISEKTIPQWAKGKADDLIDPTDQMATNKNLQRFWDEEAYAEINPMKFRTSPTWLGKEGVQTLTNVQPKVRQWFNSELAKVADDKGVVTGANLMAMKKVISDKAAQTKFDVTGASQQTESLSKVIDSMIERQLKAGAKPNSKGAQIYDRWMQNKPAYANFLDMRRAGAKASRKQGEFTPSDLAASSASRSGERRAFTGEGALQKAAQQAQRGLRAPVEDPSYWRTIAGLGLVGGSIVSPAMAAIYPALRGVSSAGFQRALTGRTGAQAAMRRASDALADRVSPEMMERISNVLRAGAASSAAD